MDDTKIVDQLLKSEESANSKIKDAQRDREKKIKEAKIAAEQEIQYYRKQEQEKYELQIDKANLNKDESKDNQAIDTEIKQIYDDFGRKKNKVVDLLIDRIMQVNLQIPLVLKEEFE